MGRNARLVAAVVGALAATAARRSLDGTRSLERTNFRGRPVSLAGGPALAVGASAAASLAAGAGRPAAAALVAGLGSGLVGGYDDVVGGRPEQKTAKGFRGHLAALREGRVTSGLVKIAGVGAAGLAAAALVDSGRAGSGARRAGRGRAAGRIVDVVLGAGVIAGSANLVNLLDLRPGRALKAGLLTGVPLALTRGRAGDLAAGASGAAAALLPADLGEEIMLGDAGANALGAVLGTAVVAGTGRLGRAGVLAGLVALTLASEKVSFTRVIERTPVLRELDALGRRTG
jgi:UDP-N-acetylmuramyl pentapeptide phosphotransferase/UDP-N-acetylglucosamine-1-phosphate transferase